MNNISTMTLRHSLLLYASSRRTRSSGITLQRNNDDGGGLHSVGTLAGTLILARQDGNHDKQAIKSRMTCKLA